MKDSWAMDAIMGQNNHAGKKKPSMAGSFGYINKKGEIVIRPKFNLGSEFSQGLAVVAVNERWGFIDHGGAWVIEPKFEYADDFENNIAQVRYEGKDGFIDIAGDFVIKPEYECVQNFSEGLAAASKKRSGGYGYINIKGESVIEPKFDFAYMFWNDMAKVIFKDKYYFINKKGEIVEECPSPGKLTATNINGKLAYKNENGIIIENPYERYRALDFNDGLCPVEIDGKDGYTDLDDNIVIEPVYDMANSFSEGFARVGVFSEQGSSDWFIDKKGRRITGLSFDIARDFSEGFAAVCVNEKWGFIDRSGEFAITPRYEWAGAFSEGIAAVSF